MIRVIFTDNEEELMKHGYDVNKTRHFLREYIQGKHRGLLQTTDNYTLGVMATLGDHDVRGFGFEFKLLIAGDIMKQHFKFEEEVSIKIPS